MRLMSKAATLVLRKEPVLPNHNAIHLGSTTAWLQKILPATMI